MAVERGGKRRRCEEMGSLLDFDLSHGLLLFRTTGADSISA